MTSIDAQSFIARVDAKKIIEGSYVEVEFILDNVEGDNFTPPKFKNFSVLSGPNRSSSCLLYTSDAADD